MEFSDQESSAFDEIMDVMKKYSGFESIEAGNERIISLPGLTIYPERRKAYCAEKEVLLSAKEFDILCILASNKGRVLTYEQIYHRIWGEEALKQGKNAVACHIRDLRRKLYAADASPHFSIRCVREIGYSMETEDIKSGGSL